MDRDLTIWHNGKFIPWRKATVPLLSHGFSRASAIFEVFSIHKGKDGTYAFRMDEHIKRLTRSAELLEMELAYSPKEIAEAIAETARRNKIGNGFIKILAYWGEEAIVQLVLESKLDMAIFAIPDSDDLGFEKTDSTTCCISKWRKIHPETVPVSAKACSNYLNGYLVRKDAMKRGFGTGLMLTTDGFLAEGSIESVFLVKDDVLKTPPLGRILASITRFSILEVAATINIPVSESAIRPDELYDAEEIFTASSGNKILPISRFEDRTLKTPGKITKQLIELMDNVMTFKDKRFAHWFFRLYENGV